MNEGGVPAGKIYDAADIAADPHFIKRDMLIKDSLPGGTPVTLPGIVPKLLTTPGQIRSKAPTLGEHTNEVLLALGLSPSQQDDLKSRGII
ncbi:CoA transferase [Pantoea tagorei]